MKKKILGLILSLGFFMPAFASLGVSPTRIEINANKVKGNYITTAIDVKGDESKPTRYKVYPGYFTVNEKAEVVMIDESNDIYNLSKKLKFLPAEFTVAPGKSQKVRINIANLNSLPNGESRAMLYIENIEPKENNIPVGPSGFSAKLIVKTRVAVPIYVDKGKFTKSAEVESLNIVKEKDGLYTNMKIASTGTTKIRYTGHVQIVQGKKLIGEYDIPGTVVASGKTYVAKNKIKTDDIKTSGQYTLRTVVSYYDENGKKKNIKKETILNIQGNV